MIANSTNLKLNFFLSQRLDSRMLPNFYIKLSYKFTMIRFIAEPLLKFRNDNRYSL